MGSGNSSIRVSDSTRGDKDDMSIRIDPTGIHVGNVVRVGWTGIDVMAPDKGTLLFQSNDLVTYCEDGVCEEFKCLGTAKLRKGTLVCDDLRTTTILRSSKTNNNDMPLTKA